MTIFFVLATFLIMIVFLNMLIAIMGDAFDYATEKKENNKKVGMLQIMGNYVNLTEMDGNIEKMEYYRAKPNDENDEKKDDNDSDSDIEKEDNDPKNKLYDKNFLYIVEP